MKFTTEDLKKIETKTVANILRKIADGKTPTAREAAILAQASTAQDSPGDDAPSPATGGYAKTWDELADACRVDRRTLTNVRQRFGKKCPKDRPDGRKEIAAWIKFLSDAGVKGRGENNPDIDFLDERQLRLQREQFQLEKAKFELRCAKEQMVPVVHVEAALGAMLAKFRQGLDSLPGRIAGGIDEADKLELLALLKRAEKQKLTLKQLRTMIEKGQVRPFADVHARRAFVETEVDQVQRTLAQCEYLEADPDADEED